ncbi:hypothetical protein Barb6_02964 [Bacteroidales bacterium Barb6]|nr:hypothetical protein Barb6_02964 [Bacteroidales bacterium Barb6]
MSYAVHNSYRPNLFIPVKSAIRNFCYGILFPVAVCNHPRDNNSWISGVRPVVSYDSNKAGLG